MGTSEMHFEGRINKSEEQVNKKKKREKRTVKKIAVNLKLKRVVVPLTAKGKFQRGVEFVETLSVEDMMANIQGEVFHYHRGDLGEQIHLQNTLIHLSSFAI